MDKRIITPVIALIVCASVLLGMYNILGGIRQERIGNELQRKMQTILPGSQTFEPEAYTGDDANIQAVYKGDNGYVVLARTSGYVAEIAVLIGVSDVGQVTGLQIRDMQETPGLGGRALTDAEFLAQFLLTDGNATVGTNIDAIAGATVTSKAVARCVNSAVALVTGADASSNATTWGG